MPIALAVIIAFAARFQIGTDFYNAKMWSGALLGVVLFGLASYLRAGLVPALAIVWTLAGAATLFLKPTVLGLPVDNQFLSLMQWSGAQAGLLCLLFVAPFLILNQERTKVVLRALAILCLTDSLYVIGQTCLGTDPYLRNGFFFNASLNACLMAVLYPILAESEIFSNGLPNTLKRILPVAAVACTHSVLGWFAMAAAFAFCSFPVGIALCSLSGLGSVLAGVRYFTLGSFLPDSSGRFSIWKMCLEFWPKNISILFGSGQGSATYLIPLVQQLDNATQKGYRPGEAPSPIHDYFLWAHNEWLQIFLEQGVIGLVLWGAVYCLAVKRSIESGNKWLAISLGVLGAISFGNYPFRFFTTALVASFLVFCGLDAENINKGKFECPEIG